MDDAGRCWPSSRLTSPPSTLAHAPSLSAFTGHLSPSPRAFGVGEEHDAGAGAGFGHDDEPQASEWVARRKCPSAREAGSAVALLPFLRGTAWPGFPLVWRFGYTRVVRVRSIRC
jgi:hypothetical protein